MITRYNATQLVKAVVAALLGGVCLYLTFLFFRHAPPFVAGQFGYSWTPLLANIVASICVIIVLVSGYLTWRSQGGLHGYHESSLYHDLGEDTAGAYVVDHYAHRVTAPAYVLVQLFLSGPLQLLRCRTLLGSLVPKSPELELRLQSTLETLRRANKWQSLNEYPSLRTEVLYLAQMGLIDFSAHKGVPRFKAQ
jgi:hypothetical protein